MKAIPTLEEVKEYFKNAKEVQCFGDKKIYDISFWTDYNYHNKADGDYNVNVSKTPHETVNDHAWIYHMRRGYAKIISYKEETYQITKEQILKYNMKDEFPLFFKAEEEFFNSPILSLNDLLSVWSSGNNIEIYKTSPLFKSFENLAKSKII